MPRIVACLIGLFTATGYAANVPPPVGLDAAGRLAYRTTDRGDRVPDFSTCGYAGGDREVPLPAVTVYLKAAPGDSTARIQTAIDHVASLPPDKDGIRGVVHLLTGEHRVEGRLTINSSGVVLRGAGADRTTLVATGEGRRPLLTIGGQVAKAVQLVKPVTINAKRVAVGETKLPLPAGHGFQVGDEVLVTRPSTDAWIDLLGARVDGVGWRAGRCDVRWRRVIVAVNGDTITLDAPLTTALEEEFGGGTVAKALEDTSLHEVGIEDLTLRSESASSNSADEEHSWHGVVMNHTRDAWVRRVRFEGFAGGAVLLREGARRVTVEDCLSLAPVSEVGGYRRQAFFTQGQQTLFLRCWSEGGQNDFCVGHAAPGPNAFVHCVASRTHGDSGPLESWASGVLYDNVRIDGGDLVLGNRWIDPFGAGWSAANCMAWQCQASGLACESPPGAQNWAVGYWAQPRGNGVMTGLSDFVRPTSLFQAQLRERLGAEAASRIDPLLLDDEGSTSPSPEEAAAFVARSNQPPRTLRDVIEERIAARPLAKLPDGQSFGRVVGSERSAPPKTPTHPLKVVNGWLTIDGKVVTGGVLSPTWWRGVLRPDEAPEYGPSITRFAAGREGLGLTDDLEAVAESMRASNRVVYDHHYGLWYDRRRDDHLMVRRATGAVVPPFYEQPFARTGSGRAWDGLSRYDLTRFNPWYWGRLADFAGLCDRKGLILMHQCYFQHNILEAGAHWADCPWRPANNVNDPGFTEPPPYVADKRLFIAHQFYDPKNTKLRELHRGYLAKCVDNFAQHSNVIQMTGDEFTGPTEFAQFWLETVSDRRRQIGAKGLVGLSAPRDAQEAVLADKSLAPMVDLIDIRYWCYTRDGQLYAPPAGANLAPRQHLRQWRGKPGDLASVARAVRECRDRYPGKAVTFNADRFCNTPRDGWAVLLAGGSLAEVPRLDDELRKAIVTMRPADGDDDATFELSSSAGERLAYSTDTAATISLANPCQLRWIDPKTGSMSRPSEFATGDNAPLRGRVVWVTLR